MWNVFVPSCLLGQDSKDLYGKVIEDEHVILVVDTVCGKRIGTYHNLHGKRSNIHKIKVNHNDEDVVIDLRCNYNDDITCEILKASENLGRCNVVIFEPQQILDSYFLRCDALSEVSDKNIVNTVSRMVERRDLIGKKTAVSQNLMCSWLFFFQIIGFLLDNRFARLGPIRFAIHCSSLLVHQTSRRKEYLRARSCEYSMPKTQLGLANVCVRQLLDTMIGMLVMYLFIHNSLSDQLGAHIITWAYAVADYLYSLVTWLMGAPAGLKLNKQLTEFLGHFFLYHIYLWKRYLGILQPVLGSVLWSASLLGVLGFTAQLCFLRDVLSMMTLHIYCFYVYAARLYQFQVYALSAFWRLFRGKKWNILRQRLDSVRYNVDQLFLGTLLFTILLFTLPTSALYYVVFTMLRLPVLIAHQVFYKIVQTVDMLPLYSVVMWLINSGTMSGDVLFTSLPQKSSNTSSVFSLQIIQMPFRKIISKTRNPFRDPQKDRRRWSSLVSDLFRGHLIYPWVEASPQ